MKYNQQNCPVCGMITGFNVNKPECPHCNTIMKIQIINSDGDIIYE